VLSRISWIFAIAVLALQLLGLRAFAGQVAAVDSTADSTMSEELLRTLHLEGQLSDESYRRLLEKLREERRLSSETAKNADRDWRFRWKNGLRFERRDGLHKLTIAGHVQNDWSVIEYDRTTKRAQELDQHLFTGTEFRRARIAFKGQLYKRIRFKAQFDFSNGGADLKGAWIAIRKLGPLGTLKIGQFRAPLSLEGRTGSKYTSFMERGLPNALVPDRGTGFSFSNAHAKRRITWTLSAQRSTDDSGRGFNSDVAYDVGGRLTALPVYENKGARLIHLGASYIHQFRSGEGFRSGDERVRYRARPESRLARRLVTTTRLETRGQQIFGFEFAVVEGPVSFQTEFIGSMVNRRDEDDSFLWGAYGFASLSLTGEHREYDKRSGTFDRLRPKRPFDPDKGNWGAWELVARVSILNLEVVENDKHKGGELRDFTAGVNWALYANFRAMLNYVVSDSKGDGITQGITQIGQLRFQLDF